MRNAGCAACTEYLILSMTCREWWRNPGGRRRPHAVERRFARTDADGHLLTCLNAWRRQLFPGCSPHQRSPPSTCINLATVNYSRRASDVASCLGIYALCISQNMNIDIKHAARACVPHFWRFGDERRLERGVARVCFCWRRAGSSLTRRPLLRAAVLLSLLTPISISRFALGRLASRVCITAVRGTVEWACRITRNIFAIFRSLRDLHLHCYRRLYLYAARRHASAPGRTATRFVFRRRIGR